MQLAVPSQGGTADALKATMLPVASSILEIIRLSLELSIKLLENMTPEHKKAFAERHERRMEFWEKLFTKESDDKPKPPV